MKKKITRDAFGGLPRSTLCDEMDGFLVTSDVVDLLRLSKRQIDRLIADQKFPAPDVPSRKGSANRWRRSTIRRALDAMVQSARESR